MAKNDSLTKKSPRGQTAQVRQSFTVGYFEALQAAFAEHGAKAIETCAKEEPAKFLDICSRHIPRDVTVSLERRDGLGPVDLEILRGIAASISDADNRPPGEVLALVAEAVRIHMAGPILENDEKQ